MALKRRIAPKLESAYTPDMTSKNEENAAQTAVAKSNAVKVFLISMVIIIPVCIYLIFFANGIFYNLSGHGMVALVIAIVLSVLSAFFFMGMSFFSSRSGVDDQPNYREIVEKQRAQEANK